VNHEVLLAKLEFNGTDNMAGRSIKSYLTDGYQRILINSNYIKSVSEWQKTKQGVPQGSILGPLIFFYILMICLT
jgi:hypothetical protein